MYLKKNLKYMMNKNNLSYRKLSELSGVSIRTISYLLTREEYSVSLKTAMALSKCFSINLDDIVYKDLSKD